MEGVPRPVLCDLDHDVVQVARGVRVVSDEGGDVKGHPPEDREDDILQHFGRRQGVEAPVVHRCEAQVLLLQGEFPVRLQLEFQVGDGVCRRYPVPWGFGVGAEAQLQAQDFLRGGHGALARLELHAPRTQVCGHSLRALDEVLQRVGHHQQDVYIGLEEVPYGLSWRAQAVPLGLE